MENGASGEIGGPYPIGRSRCRSRTMPDLWHRESGIALMTVLWLLALLGIVTTMMTVRSVSTRRQIERYGEAVQMREALDGAIRFTLFPWIANPNKNSTAMSAEQLVADLPIQVSIERESGRIDLNAAPKDLLAAFFEAGGWEVGRAQMLAARIQDWRDADDTPESLGAEAPEYAAAGRLGPRNAPFQSIGEVRRVLGAETIDARLINELTVYTHEPEPTRNLCRPTVCAALNAWARQFAPSDKDSIKTDAAPTMTSLLHSRVSLIGEVIRVRACAKGNRETPCRIMIGRLTGSVDHPLQVFEWSSSFDLRD